MGKKHTSTRRCDNILVISTCVVKPWDPGPQQIKLFLLKVLRGGPLSHSTSGGVFESLSTHLQCRKSALSCQM
jgi:hypothetical protein